MKKALTTIAILGGIAAAVAYKLKKDEEKKILELEQELLKEENEEGTAEETNTDVSDPKEAACEGEATDEEAACGCGCEGEEDACCCGSHEENTEAALPTEEAPVDPAYPHLSAEDKQSIDDMNREVIQGLEEGGDVHENERPIQHTIAFTNAEELENYKTIVINKGFVVTKGENDLELYVLHIASIDRIQLLQNIYYLANLAVEMHGTYKGWKSRVSY